MVELYRTARHGKNPSRLVNQPQAQEGHKMKAECVTSLRRKSSKAESLKARAPNYSALRQL